MQIFILFTLISVVSTRKHYLNIKNDDRQEIQLSTFGFLKGGELSVNITNFHYGPHESNKQITVKNGTLGFTLDKTTISGISPDMNNISPDGRKNECMLKKENLEMDNSLSVVFFSLDVHNKRLTIDRKGKDIMTLKIYYHQTNITDTKSFTNRSKRADIDQHDTGLSLKTEKPAETTKKADVATTHAVIPEAVTHAAEPPTGETDILEKLKESEHKYGIEATDSIPVRIDAEGLIHMSFRVLIETDNEEGLYNFFFHNCGNYDSDVNFTSRITERNRDSYLSAGEMPLPTFYFVMCIVYAFLAGIWLMVLKRATDGVIKTHYLMLSFLIVKALSLLFHAIDFHFIKINGQHGEAFAILYYITYLMKGTLLLVTILLVGVGWSFIKHILSKKEKKLFIVIIPLQILANVAQVIIQETEEGTQQYTTWKAIFLSLDLLCCGAILFPVIWSIRHLQDASQTDGKAAMNLAKLKIFRHFYILIVCYIYSTRIIAYLFAITLPFHYGWICFVFKESANIVFFVMTGIKFRPASDNPYLQIPQSDTEEEMDEVLTKGGAVEGVTRVNFRDTDSMETTLTRAKQRESSHEYD